MSYLDVKRKIDEHINEINANKDKWGRDAYIELMKAKSEALKALAILESKHSS